MTSMAFVPHAALVATFSLAIVAVGAAEQAAPPAAQPTAPAKPQTPPPAQTMPIIDPAYVYEPAGRRDPFISLVGRGESTAAPAVRPPGLSGLLIGEITVKGVVRDRQGFIAMVQAPDGKGYSLRRGTRVGPNNGVVSSITERGIIVQERFTDVYGNKQERDYVKLLHPKEGIE